VAGSVKPIALPSAIEDTWVLSGGSRWTLWVPSADVVYVAELATVGITLYRHRVYADGKTSFPGIRVGFYHTFPEVRTAAFSDLPELVQITLAAKGKPNPARLNPIKRTFTPSYPAGTREEYEQAVRQGKKRLLHIQVEGGRARVRYGEQSPDHDPPGHREPARMEAKTKRRLAQQEPPWNARTQSVEAHVVSKTDRSGKEKGEPAEALIHKAIEAYRAQSPQGNLGLLVPHDPRVLIRLGMPPKAAQILTTRAPGILFSVLSEAPTVSGVETLEATIARGLGRRLLMRWDGKLVLPVGNREAEVVSVSIRGPRGRQFPALTEDSIASNYFAWQEKIKAERPGEKYRPEADDPAFLQQQYVRLLSTIRAVAQRWSTDDLLLTLSIRSRGVVQEREVSVGEHSKPVHEKVESPGMEYRYLKHVSLSELPTVLARLARRKKRAGRRLPKETSILARSNPNLSTLEQLLAQPGAEPIPVPGKPGRVYVYSRRRKAVIETTPDRARTWQAIGAAGRTARNELSQAATASYAQENPMARKPHYDDRYFTEQYSQGPYGARAALPAARRNGSEKVGPVLFTKKGQPYRRTADGKARFISKAEAAKTNGRFGRAATENPGGRALVNRKRGAKRKVNPLAAAAVRRAHEIFRSQGCSMGDAMRQAWADVRAGGGARAAANPWYSVDHSPLYLPDETQTRSALVRGPYGDLAFTNPGSALGEERASMLPDVWGESDFWGGRQLQRGGFAMREGQFGASGTGGFQPVNRRNPRKKAAKKNRR
jgi:hypothetical protein